MKHLIPILLFMAAVLSGPANAYPPDNAALIYYKYMVNFAMPDDPLGDQISDAAKGNTEVNEEIEAFLNKKRQLINALETASNIPMCDWGLDFSEGLSLEMSHLRGMKSYTYILLADAQLKKQNGQYAGAMDQCLVVLRMAGHVGNDTLISYLVGTAMSTLTYGAMEDILSAMPPDAAFLTELPRELKLPEYNILNIKTPLLNESRYLSAEILRIPEKKEDILELLGCEDDAVKKDLPLLLEGDPEFLAASAEHYRQFFDHYMNALNLPYEQTLQTFDELKDKPKKEFEAGNKEAFATALLAPATTKCYNIDIRRRTYQNALYTAFDVYLYYAKNGTLPPKLPLTSYVDLYSSQPFAYEITAEGFTLRCNAEDKLKNKTWEYIFRIAQ